MKTIVASALLLGMFQQTLADDPPAPKYIPPLPPPTVVKPAFAPTALFQIQRLIAPSPETKDVLPRSEHDKPAQPQPANYYSYSAVPPKRIEKTRSESKKQNRPGVTSFIHRAKHVSAKEFASSLSRKFAMDSVINLSYQKNKTKNLVRMEWCCGQVIGRRQNGFIWV